MPTGTFYSNAGGHGRIVNNNTNWTTLRNLTTGSPSNQWFHQTSYGAPTYYLYRVFMPFDTSAIPVGSVINSWSISIYRDDSGYSFNNANTCSLIIFPSTQVDPTSLAGTDFDNISYSNKGSLAFASTTNNAYFTIDGTDTSLIVPGSYTKLCVSSDRDLNNSAPTGNNSIYGQAVGEANPPYMTVDYTPPPNGAPMFFSSGVTIA